MASDGSGSDQRGLRPMEGTIGRFSDNYGTVLEPVRLCPKPHSHSGEKQEKRKFTDVFRSALIGLLIRWSWVRVPAASLVFEGFGQTTTSCTHSVPISRVGRVAVTDDRGVRSSCLERFLIGLEQDQATTDRPPLNGTASRETIWGRSKPREAINATRKEGTS